MAVSVPHSHHPAADCPHETSVQPLLQLGGLPRFVRFWDLELHQVLLPPISFPCEATVYPKSEYPPQPHFTSFSSLAQCSRVLLGWGGEQWWGLCDPVGRQAGIVLCWIPTLTVMAHPSRPGRPTAVGPNAWLRDDCQVLLPFWRGLVGLGPHWGPGDPAPPCLSLTPCS